jgi:hypothetical protein
MRVNVLEKELQRLAMYGHNDPATSKRGILEQACTALGHPVPAFVPDPTGEYKNPKRMKKTTMNTIYGSWLRQTNRERDTWQDDLLEDSNNTRMYFLECVGFIKKPKRSVLERFADMLR